MAFKFCNRLLECGLWFAGDCVYELGPVVAHNLHNIQMSWIRWP